MSHPSETPEDDPLGLEGVDREIRIAKLRRELDELTDGVGFGDNSGGCDPKVEEAFLENVLAMERHGFVCPLDELKRGGLELPPPESLDDTALNAKLWELIRAMADRRLFLHCTDHLGDRELYAWLLEEGLTGEMMGFGLPFGNCHIDVIGSGSEEDIQLQMRYYASEEERARWAKDFPDDPMPPREKPPRDRDRHLPQAED